MLCWSAFPLVPALRSAGSATDCSVLFAGFIATITWVRVAVATFARAEMVSLR